MSVTAISFPGSGFTRSPADPAKIMDDFTLFLQTMDWPQKMTSADYFQYISSSDVIVNCSTGYNDKERQLVVSNVFVLRTFANAFTDSLAALQPSQFTLRM